MQYISCFLRDVVCAFESSISSEALPDVRPEQEPRVKHERLSHHKFRSESESESESDATLINCLRVYTWALSLSFLLPCRPTLY